MLLFSFFILFRSSLPFWRQFQNRKKNSGIYVLKKFIEHIEIVPEGSRSYAFKLKSPFCVNYEMINEMSDFLDAAVGIEVSMFQ